MLKPRRPLRVRLRVGISTAFLLIFGPLFVATVGYLYRSTSDLALGLATTSMVKATQDIADDVRNLLSPAERLVEAAAVLARLNRDNAHQDAGFQFLLQQIKVDPQIYSAYVAYGSDGSFYQVLQVPPGIASFGPADRKPPDRTRFALRHLDSHTGERIDTFTYLADWGDPVGSDAQRTEFDPRVRPWYLAAGRDGKVALSDAYVFVSSNRPGITVSLRVADDQGIDIGAVGADVALDGLSRFLDRKRIGIDGRLFILDSEHRLLGASSTHAKSGGAETAMVLGRDASDPVIAGSVRRWEATGADRFTAEFGLDQIDYLVSFAPFPKEFEKRWTIGVAVDRDEFVGPIRLMSRKILLIGAVTALIATAAILMLSRRLTDPLLRVIRETERIRDFDLASDVKIRSRIVEVNELGTALDAMKGSLRSFGAYVPKQLVRSIVSSGATIAVGGERRLVTVMFSDIQDFTRKSETLPPEHVLATLSTYFESLSKAIHENRGTIDKFIGDAIMAVWNAPTEDADHIHHACLATLACKDVAEKLNATFAGDSMGPLFTRFGVHSGEVMVGNVGSTDRMQYTALGSAVNSASRLEGLNKFYRTQLLVTDTVEEAARDDFVFRPVDRVAPVGISQPFAIFELMGTLGAAGFYTVSDEKLRMLKQWSDCYELYLARDWGKAQAGFAAFADAYPADGLVRIYLQRCSAYLAEPPPPDWDGAQHLRRK